MKKSVLALLPALLLCPLLLLLLFLLQGALGTQSAAEEEDSTAVVVILEEDAVPQNDYDSQSFTSETDGTVTYADESYRSLSGIDVSSHQGSIDWSAVAASGVEFAILRIGYRGYTAGGLNEDSCFAENLAGAREAGLQLGVYFYSQALSVEEAEEEAAFVLALLDGVALELPVFFDWEKQTATGSRTLSADHSLLTDCALAFCGAITQGGYQAGVYFYSSLALDSYQLSALTDYCFWFSQPGEQPDFDYSFTLWQYSYSGEVSGIEGKVDLDLLFVTE